MHATIDGEWMAATARLAARARPASKPNPGVAGLLVREGRADIAKACFDFLPTRARLDLAGWPETDIFAHS